MRLMYSPVQQVFMFVLGDSPTRLDGEPMFFRNKNTAISAARSKGLKVDKRGFVSAINPSNMNGLDGGLEGGGYMIRFMGAPYANELYTERGADPKNLEEAVEAAEALYPDDAWELWGPDGGHSNEAFDAQFDGLEGLNQPEYTHYVVAQINGNPRIESGWSYAEDAKEHQEDNMPDNLRRGSKVLTKTGVRRLGIDPNKDADWVNGADSNTHLGEVSSRTRLGSRVRFDPNRASLMLYTHHPEIGEEGTVTTMPGFGKRTYLPGPGGGLLYVKWDDHGVMGVSPKDVEKVSGKARVKVGRGRPAGLSGLADRVARQPKQAWMRKMESALMKLAPEKAGKIDWDTATHLFNVGDSPEEAAKKMARL